jgi:hypothetical protein
MTESTLPSILKKMERVEMTDCQSSLQKMEISIFYTPIYFNTNRSVIKLYSDHGRGTPVMQYVGWYALITNITGSY